MVARRGRETRMNHPFPPFTPLFPPSRSLLCLCRSHFLLRETPPWTNYTYRQSSLVPRVRSILPLSFSRLSIFLQLSPSLLSPFSFLSFSHVLPLLPLSLCPPHPNCPITTIRNDHVIIATPVEHVPVRIPRSSRKFIVSSHRFALDGHG